MHRRWLLTMFVVLFARDTKPPSVDSVQASVVVSVQNGELKQAQKLLDNAFGKGVLLKPPATPDTFLSTRISQSDADRLRLLQSEILLERGEAPAALEFLDQLKDPADPESHLRWRVNRAVALSKTDKLDLANAVLDQVDQESQNLSLSEPVLKARLLRGTLLTRTKHLAQADSLFSETAATAERAGLPFYRAAALLNLSFSSLQRRRYDESVEFALQALKIGNRRLAAAIHNNLGVAYYRLGDLDTAELHGNQAIDLSKKAGDSRTYADALGNLANIDIELLKFPEAVKALEEALELSKKIGAKSDAYRWAGNLATAHLNVASAYINGKESDADNPANDVLSPAERAKKVESELAAAERANDEALGLRNQLEHPDKPLLLQFNAAEIAVDRNQSEEAEKRYRALIDEKPDGFLEWAAHARLGKLFATQKRFAEARHEYELALTAVEGERSSLNKTESRLTFRNHLIRFFWNYVDLLVSEGRYNEALEVVEYSRARVMVERLGLQPRSIQQVRAAAFQDYARRSRDVMLSYWLAPERSFAWVVDANGIHWSVLENRKTITNAVSLYRRAIEDLRDPIAENLTQGTNLTRLLLDPVKQYLEGAQRVVVVPDGDLHLLNLETLPMASKDGTRYWIESTELAVTPSLILLSEGLSTVKATAKPSMLLFGAPTSIRADYPELRGAKSEIDSIGRMFGGSDTIVSGAQATPSGFLAAMPAMYSMIHFATHAEANPLSPLDSAVILSDDGKAFKLYARDIASLKLSASLVTISACRSAGARSYHGEGIVGFAWAFMQSGVRTVIAGLWDVDDTYSSQLMTTLYKGIAAHARPSTALRAAKLELLRSNGGRLKPVYWAPFQAYLR